MVRRFGGRRPRFPVDLGERDVYAKPFAQRDEESDRSERIEQLELEEREIPVRAHFRLAGHRFDRRNDFRRLWTSRASACL